MKLRVLLLVLVPPILLFLCALVTLWMPLPQPFPPPLSGGRNRMAAVMTGILGIGYVAGLAAYVIASVLRAGRILDPVLASAGLVSESYRVFGRQYTGVIRGREVAVRFLPPQGINPALLNVHVVANLGMRVAIGHKRPLLDCRDCAQFNVGELDLGHLQVYAEDQECARSLLADPVGRAALRRLMEPRPMPTPARSGFPLNCVDDREALGFRELYLQPERVWLRARPRQITEPQLRQWLDDMLALAEAGERTLDSHPVTSRDAQC